MKNPIKNLATHSNSTCYWDAGQKSMQMRFHFSMSLVTAIQLKSAALSFSFQLILIATQHLLSWPLYAASKPGHLSHSNISLISKSLWNASDGVLNNNNNKLGPINQCKGHFIFQWALPLWLVNREKQLFFSSIFLSL